MATLRMSSAVRRSQHAFHTAQRNNIRQFSSSPLHQALVGPEGEGTKASDHATASKTTKSSSSEEAKGSSSEASYGEGPGGGAMSGDIKVSANKDDGTGKSRGIATGDSSGDSGKKGSGSASGRTASVA